jgi:hypothetical protein
MYPYFMVSYTTAIYQITCVFATEEATETAKSGKGVKTLDTHDNRNSTELAWTR